MMPLPNCGTCGRAPAVRPSQGTSLTSTPSLYVCCLHSAGGDNGGWHKVERSCHSHKGNRGLRPWPHDPDRSRECPRSLKFGGRVFPGTKASKSWAGSTPWSVELSTLTQGLVQLCSQQLLGTVVQARSSRLGARHK